MGKPLDRNPGIPKLLKQKTLRTKAEGLASTALPTGPCPPPFSFPRAFHVSSGSGPGPPTVTQQVCLRETCQNSTWGAACHPWGTSHLSKHAFKKKTHPGMINDKCHVPGRNVRWWWIYQSYSMHASAIRTPIDTNQDTNNFKLYCRADSIRWLRLSPTKISCLCRLCTLNWRAYNCCSWLTPFATFAHSVCCRPEQAVLSNACHRSKQCQHHSNPCDHCGCLPRYLYQRRVRIWVWVVVLPVQAVDEDHQRIETQSDNWGNQHGIIKKHQIWAGAFSWGARLGRVGHLATARGQAPGTDHDEKADYGHEQEGEVDGAKHPQSVSLLGAVGPEGHQIHHTASLV